MSTTSPDTVLALARSYMEARVLLTAAELDLFSRLARQPQTAAALAAALPGDERALTILLDALTALELLAKRDGTYHCPPPVAALLATDAPAGILPMVLHQANLWQRWHELTGIARGDAAARARAQAPRGGGDQRAFIGAMQVVGAALAPLTAGRVQPRDARRLLDIGGASGTYTIAFLRAAPQLRATLFDLPPVIELARERLGREGLLDRVDLVGGDFERDALPGGHDLALLSAIIHQNSADQNIALYRNVHQALVPGGRLIIRDYVMDPDRTQPHGGAVFAVNMLVGTAGGNVYTLAECAAHLAAAGFERVRLLHAGREMDSLVEAFRPAAA